MNYKRIILDQYDEMSAGIYTADDMAKTAGLRSIQSAEDISRLEDDDFAVVIVKHGEKYRKFPINTIDNTRISKEAFLRNYTKMTLGGHEVASFRLKKACARFGLAHEDVLTDATLIDSPYYLHTFIKDAQHEAKLAQSQMNKEASLKKFAINAQRNGHPIQKYAINDADEVKTASLEINTRMPIEWFMKAAKAVLDRAKELNISIPDDSEVNIIKNASLSPFFRFQIRERMKLSSGDGAVKYAELLNKSAESDLPSIAVELEYLDEQHGHRSKWGKALFTPAIAVWGLPKKAEAIDMDTGTMDSERLAAFVQDHKDQLAAAIGEEATQSLIEDPITAFKALPAPHRQYISESIGGSA